MMSGQMHSRTTAERNSNSNGGGTGSEATVVQDKGSKTQPDERERTQKNELTEAQLLEVIRGTDDERTVAQRFGVPLTAVRAARRLAGKRGTAARRETKPIRFRIRGDLAGRITDEMRREIVAMIEEEIDRRVEQKAVRLSEAVEEPEVEPGMTHSEDLAERRRRIEEREQARAREERQKAQERDMKRARAERENEEATQRAERNLRRVRHADVNYEAPVLRRYEGPTTDHEDEPVEG